MYYRRMVREAQTLSRPRRIAFILVTLIVGMTVALAIGEVILRVTAIPGIEYHTFAYDAVTGGTPYPGSTILYRDDRGNSQQRRVNDQGFLSAPFTPSPATGSYRIAFFGDSYTEARQVALDETFPRRIQRELNAGDVRPAVNRSGEPVERIETIALGVSGRGALQSYLEYEKRCDVLQPDLVVYVFCENDPGDQMRGIQPDNVRPFAELDGDGFRIDNRFREQYAFKATFLHRFMQRLKSHSLVLSTIEGRLKLLKRHGVKTRVTQADRAGDTGGRPGMSPSTWGDSLAAYGWTLEERIVDRWRDSAREHGSRFWILRVPRESKIHEPVEKQDSWALKLYAYVARTGIPLVDPTPQLLDAMEEGKEVYYDHFTPDGHDAVASAFAAFFTRRLRDDNGG